MLPHAPAVRGASRLVGAGRPRPYQTKAPPACQIGVPVNAPIQPVANPILCNPYEEPTEHWLYNRETGQAEPIPGRRDAGYYFKTERTGSAQQQLFADEQREDLPLVNQLRDDVRRWRQANYLGASVVSRELLRHWARPDRPRRLFFCQL